MAQWVKDPAFLQLWHRSQLWLSFDPWPENLHMLQVQPKKKIKKKKKPQKAILLLQVKLKPPLLPCPPLTLPGRGSAGGTLGSFSPPMSFPLPRFTHMLQQQRRRFCMF